MEALLAVRLSLKSRDGRALRFRFRINRFSAASCELIQRRFSAQEPHLPGFIG